MPTISIITGPLSKDQKKEMIKSMTEISMRITGAPEAVHTVLIQELEYDSMGIGKKTVEEMMKSK